MRGIDFGKINLGRFKLQYYVISEQKRPQISGNIYLFAENLSSSF